MDKSVVKSLGLFNLPPTVRKRDKDEKAEDTMLLNSYKDFFKGVAAEGAATGTADDEEMKDESANYV